jgi:hypothetical protein
MSHIHVCLVSDQTIPNILGIHHFSPDNVLFVSTSDMEKKNKVKHMLQALMQIGLNYGNRFQKIVVQEDSLLDCKKKLDEWITGREGSEFTVNLTGGTKIMSIAVYEYFKDYGSKMIYIPLGHNEFIMPFPKRASNTATPLTLRLKVADYLAAYGLSVTNEKKLAENHANAECRKNLTEWIVRNYDAIKFLLERFGEKLRKHRDDKGGYFWNTSYLPQNDQEKELFTKAKFFYDNGSYQKQLNRSEIIYLTGGWLEEYCYNEIACFKGKGIDDVVIGIIPETNGRKNEFDVMFTKDNALYTVECKSLDQNDDMKADALYKIAALQKEFGLRVESFFVSTSPHIMKEGKIKPSIEARAAQFKTTVITPNEVVSFSKILAEKLKIKTEE